MNLNETSAQSQSIPIKESTIKKTSSIEEMVADTCFCKLRASCPDKTSDECMKHRNIYQEFMSKVTRSQSKS